MNFTPKKRLLALFFWTVILSAVYWGLGNTALAIPVMATFAVLCLVLSVFYIFVNGGIRPILDEDRRKEEKTREKYLQDKGKLHPVKRKDKYRRFRIKKEGISEKKEEIPLPPRPNPLKLPEEKRILLSQVLLVITVPFYLIFLLDWVIVTFFC